MNNDPLPDTVHEHARQAIGNVSFFLLVVSSTRHLELRRGSASTDRTVPVVAALVKKAGHELRGHEVVPDDPAAITPRVRALLDDMLVDVILTSGGTGISPKDKTVEAVSVIGLPPLPGFGELFRLVSHEEIGSAAMLSRATAFTGNKKAIFCLPGSPKAVRTALSALILPEIGHLLSQLRKDE